MVLKDIHQEKDFVDERQKVMANIQFTNGWLHEKVKHFLGQADITPQQYNMLRILRASDVPLSTMQIRERMFDKMSDTSRLVDRLILKGLIEKKVCLSDKRLVDISITDKGVECLNKLDIRNEEFYNIVSGLTTEEARLLDSLLDKIRHPELSVAHLNNAQ